jgi:putative membrane protein
MEYMFEAGFLGTRAPLFMDMVTVIVALLPFLLALAIYPAMKGNYKTHKFAQVALYVVSVVVVGYFEYGVRIGGGFEEFIKGSSMSHSFVYYFLLMHIIIAIITLVVWTKALIGAIKSSNLPGSYSIRHKKEARIASMFILATGITGLAVYFMLFVL